MSEDAQHYQSHKDDAGEWGEAEQAPVSASRRLAAMFSVRFTPEELDAVRAAAEGLGQSVSQFVRQASLQRAGVGPTVPITTTSLQEISRRTAFEYTQSVTVLTSSLVGENTTLLGS